MSAPPGRPARRPAARPAIRSRIAPPGPLHPTPEA